MTAPGSPTFGQPRPTLDPTTLKAPLTNAQKNYMRDWIAGYLSRVYNASGQSFSYQDGIAYTASYNDKELISEYNSDYIAWHGGNAPPVQNSIPDPSIPDTVKKAATDNIPGVSSVTDFLNLLSSPHLWIRVAEFAVGAIVLGVGVNALFNGAPSRAAVKYAGVKGLV